MNTYIGVSPLLETENKSATTSEKISNYGTVMKVTQEIYIQNGPGGKEVKIINGISLKRFKVISGASIVSLKLASIEYLSEEIPKERLQQMNNEGLAKQLKELGLRYLNNCSKSQSQAEIRKEILNNEDNIVKLTFHLATYSEISKEEKIKLLEINDIDVRIKEILKHLKTLCELSEITKEIDDKTRKTVVNETRKMLLKRKSAEINKELYGSPDDENEKLAEQIENAKLPEKVQESVIQELKRLRNTPSNYPEHMVIKKYLEVILGLPWNTSSEEITDINHSETILNRDHAGLEKVKTRILEFLAVKILKKNSKGSILCLQGPPGVGKTSLGKSIAEALGRKFERISLGGVRDEAEIRGHRRTYVGALPGLFIQALLRTKTNNPVLLLDEIDKVSRGNFNGDPSAALLEVLDPNQNNTFVDHYLGVPFDLSNVLFISTSNT